MESWRMQLKFDPIPPLLISGNQALRFFVQRDLLGEQAGPASQLWQLPEARKILKKTTRGRIMAASGGEETSGDQLFAD